MNFLIRFIILLIFHTAPSLALTTDRFLKNELATLVPPGEIELEAGSNYLRGSGNYLTLPPLCCRYFGEALNLAGNIGISNRVELQLQWETIKYVIDPQLGTFKDLGDLAIYTKIQFMRNLVDASARIGMKLPNGSAETLTGTDATDLFFTLLITGKLLDNLLWTTNSGLAILGSPQYAQSQIDKLLYGGVLEWLPYDKIHFTTEIWGLTSFKKKMFEESNIRSGVVFSFQPIDIDAAFIYGLGPFNAGWGVTAGLKWRTDTLW